MQASYILCPDCELPALADEEFDLFDSDGLPVPHIRIECIAGHRRMTSTAHLTWGTVSGP